MAELKGKKDDYLGTGRRKSAVARVRIREGKGQIVINGRSLDDYFTEIRDRGAVVAAMEITDLRNRLDVMVNVKGGGFSGQAGAVSQGIARAIKSMFGPAEAAAAEKAAAEKASTAALTSLDGSPSAPKPDEEPTAEPIGIVKRLRDSGLLTRDSRMKERKKYGRKGARKSFQFSKR